MKRRPPYKYRKTRGIGGWVGLILTSLLGAVAAIATAGATIQATVDRLAPPGVPGSMPYGRSGMDGLALALIAGPIGFILGGAVGGVVAAGLYRIRPWREKLSVGWWYAVGVLRGLIGMFFILVAISLIEAGPIVTAITAVVAWAGSWTIGQLIHDSPSMN